MAVSEVRYRDRRAVRLENERLRVTVLIEGGHIAEILHKPTAVNPLWTPIWPSIEPSTFDPARHKYGEGSEAKLLAGIMGHNLCVDLFGGPSEAEAEMGMTSHGEASVAPYSFASEGDSLIGTVAMPLSQLKVQRRLRLDPNGRVLHIAETVENLTAFDRPLAWTQHVTLGPPFLERGKTQFRAPATKSRTYDAEFGNVFPRGTTFDWPVAPRVNGGTYDLRVYNTDESSGGYTAHLMDPHQEHAHFVAWHPASKLAFGYKWKRTDFPWLGIWEENHFRKQAPWDGRSVTRGMEFGVSPMPESRRAMIERKELFGVPGYAWLPAKGILRAEYIATAFESAVAPERI